MDDVKGHGRDSESRNAVEKKAAGKALDKALAKVLEDGSEPVSQGHGADFVCCAAFVAVSVLCAVTFIALTKWF